MSVTTTETDAMGRDTLAEHGVVSNLLDCGSEYDTSFPGVSCISINDELVHGILGNWVIRNDDLISIDPGTVLGDWHGDTIHSFVVDEVRAEDLKMVEATQQAMWVSVATVRDGDRVGDMSQVTE